MASIVDKLIEKRVNFLEGLKGEVAGVVSGDLNLDYENLIAQPLAQAKSNPYFLGIREKLNSKPFTWQSFLDNVPEIAGVTEIKNDSIASIFQRATAAVDNYFRQFLEPVSSLPFFYSRDSGRVEPNCVGSAQIIGTIYSFDNPASELELLFVHTTKRRENVLAYLNSIQNPAPGARESLDWVEAKVDSFSGYFPRTNLQDLLLDHVLTIEDSGHVAVRNKNGEVFDHKLEVDNFKKVEHTKIHEGLWASGITQLTQLYVALGLEVMPAWAKVRGDVKRITPGTALLVDYSLGIGSLEDLKKFYGEDLPARYLAIEALEDFQSPEKVQSTLKTLAQTYPHPRSVESISSRYLGDGANLILNAGGRK